MWTTTSENGDAALGRCRELTPLPPSHIAASSGLSDRQRQPVGRVRKSRQTRKAPRKGRSRSLLLSLSEKLDAVVCLPILDRAWPPLTSFMMPMHARWYSLASSKAACTCEHSWKSQDSGTS